MSFSTERVAIEGKFSTWTATKVKYANRPFQEPTTGPYISVNILNGEGSEATIGLPMQRRHVGVVAVQVFDRENAGDANIRTLSDQIEALFINANSRTTISATEYITYDQPSLSVMQIVNGWAQRNVTISYVRDEFK